MLYPADEENNENRRGQNRERGDKRDTRLAESEDGTAKTAKEVQEQGKERTMRLTRTSLLRELGQRRLEGLKLLQLGLTTFATQGLQVDHD